MVLGLVRALGRVQAQAPELALELVPEPELGLAQALALGLPVRS